MLTTFRKHCVPGASKLEIVEALRHEEVNRGLVFDYCLMTAGTSLNRAPSEQKWQDGEILSLDSGGNYHGYIGDLCRMAIFGEPDSELIDLLAEIESIQRAAFNAAAMLMLTWSSRFADVGIESTDAGCARTLCSDARAAAVYWWIIMPDSIPDAGARNGGSPPLRRGSTSRAVRRSLIEPSSATAIFA